MEKRLQTIYGTSVSEVIRKANEAEVTKNDFVQLFEKAGQVFLIYYK